MTARPAAAGPGLAQARWVLLRGLGREAGHWGAFPEALRAALPLAEVVRPDLPGCGLAAHTRSPANVPAILEAVRAQLGLGLGPSPAPGPPGKNAGASGGERPLGVLALSLGGMLALEWLARYPGELSGAVLINTSVGGLCPPWRRLRPRGLYHLARAALTRDPVAREGHVYTMVSARPARAAPVVEQWTALGAARPIRAVTTWKQLVAAARYRPRALPRPAAALVLASAHDGMVDPACSRVIAEAMGAHLRVHPTAGHDLPLDEPEWTAGAIADWVTGACDRNGLVTMDTGAGT